MMRQLLFLLCALGLAGCYQAHELGSGTDGRRDAGPRDLGRVDLPVPGRDAGPPDRPDFGPPRDGVYWTLERRDAVRLSIPHELGCTAHAGGRVVVRVDTAIETDCEHMGPVGIERSPDGVVVVQAHIWRRHDPDPAACPGITWLESRHVLVEAPRGPLTVVTSDGSSRVEYEPIVGDTDCDAGPMGARCTLDCQCAAGLVCVPELGDFVECSGGRCGQPCDVPNAPEGAVYAPHLDCPSLSACTQVGGLAAPTCTEIVGDGCFERSIGCGPGTFCPPSGVVSECAWDLTLRAANRHPCDSEADCDEGLHCVEHADGERRCEVPCFTNDQSCPRAHFCDPTRWVCEWIGD